MSPHNGPSRSPQSDSDRFRDDKDSLASDLRLAGRAVLESMPLRERAGALAAGRDVFATPWALVGSRHGSRKQLDDAMAPWDARDGGGRGDDSASASASASDSDTDSDASLDVIGAAGGGSGFGRTWPPHGGDAGSRSPVSRAAQGPGGAGAAAAAAADRLLDIPLSKRLVASIAEMGRLRCAAAAAAAGLARA